MWLPFCIFPTQSASGFTWLSLAGLLHCSRAWLFTGISTLLGPWLVNANAQTVSARCWWHFAEVLGLWSQVCHEDKGYDCSQTLRFLHRGTTSKWPGKKVEQRRLQGMFYKLLKIIDLWRELWSSRVERGGGRCSVGEAASPLCLGRLFHMGQDKGRGVYDPTYNSCEEERDLKWEDLRTTTLVHTNCLNATQFCTPERTAQLFLLKQFVHSWKSIKSRIIVINDTPRGRKVGRKETGRFLGVCGHSDASHICCWEPATRWEL